MQSSIDEMRRLEMQDGERVRALFASLRNHAQRCRAAGRRMPLPISAADRATLTAYKMFMEAERMSHARSVMHMVSLREEEEALYNTRQLGALAANAAPIEGLARVAESNRDRASRVTAAIERVVEASSEVTRNHARIARKGATTSNTLFASMQGDGLVDDDDALLAFADSLGGDAGDYGDDDNPVTVYLDPDPASASMLPTPSREPIRAPPPLNSTGGVDTEDDVSSDDELDSERGNSSTVRHNV